MWAQLTGGLFLDYVWPAVRFPSAGRHLAALDESQQGPDIVFFGSSRFEAGIHQAELQRALRAAFPDCPVPRTFNAAVPAGDAISGDYLLQQMLYRGVRPTLAVIEVSPETLNRHNDWLAYHVRRQLRWEDVPTFGPDILRSHQLGKFLRARLLPLYVHRRQICRELVALIHPSLGASASLEAWRSAGSGPADSARAWEIIRRKSRETPTAEQWENTQRWVGHVQRWLHRYRIAGTSARALEQMLQRCREHGIQAILVGVPVTQLHRQAYTPPIEAQFQAYVQRICRTYGCRFVDARAQVPDTLFSDNHHLLPEEGGRYFSHWLAREALAPAWRSWQWLPKPDIEEIGSGEVGGPF